MKEVTFFIVTKECAVLCDIEEKDAFTSTDVTIFS